MKLLTKYILVCNDCPYCRSVGAKDYYIANCHYDPDKVASLGVKINNGDIKIPEFCKLPEHERKAGK